ncbi:MAG: L,D-transpeptidase [Chloroflexota bacterium]|nr:L,D-transpeptidase [Chloroflexota bacterium]
MLTGGTRLGRRPRLSGRAHLLLSLILFLALFPVVTPPVAAQEWSAPRTVFVPETGHTADGYFLDVWRTQRALMGDPISQELTPRTGFLADSAGNEIVQYFQNLALVYLPTALAGEQVASLPLGFDALNEALATRPSAILEQAARRTACPPGETTACQGFADTGHTLRGDFLSFWTTGDAGRWLGPPVSEAFRAADRSIVQYLERGAVRQRVAGSVELMPLGFSTAQLHNISTEPMAQPADVPVFNEELFAPPAALAQAVPAPEQVLEESAPSGWWVGGFGPGPQQGSWKEIVISISHQALWAYEGSEMVMSTYVSTGTGNVPETVTPIGHWSILSKYDVEDMEGTISDEYYFVEAVPHVMYFDNLGNAIHGAYWHNNFGTPMSHGCVNLPLDIAAWMYAWAPIGTGVSVIP